MSYLGKPNQESKRAFGRELKYLLNVTNGDESNRSGDVMRAILRQHDAAWVDEEDRRSQQSGVASETVMPPRVSAKQEPLEQQLQQHPVTVPAAEIQPVAPMAGQSDFETRARQQVANAQNENTQTLDIEKYFRDAA